MNHASTPRNHYGRTTPALADSVLLYFLHDHVTRANDWWTRETGDQGTLASTATLLGHLVKWAVRDGRIADPGFVHGTDAELALDPVFKDRGAREEMRAEAYVFIGGLAAAKKDELERARIEAERAKAEAAALAAEAVG